ncbi:MAG: SgcJ/EcaC family oxidoreductase [Emcibacteraceae bacterium]|nr:SgcJ/EcaC family oxidoreductase [Emcibacteraceae bacterium]
MTAQAGIQKTNQAFSAAMAAGDAEGVAACYTEDGLFLVPSIPTLNGRGEIKAAVQGLIEGGITAITLKTTEIEEHGDTAIELGEFILHAGDNIADQGRFMVNWKCIDGNWLLHRDIINSTVAAG